MPRIGASHLAFNIKPNVLESFFAISDNINLCRAMLSFVSVFFFLCALVLLTKRWHIRHTAKGHFASAKQSSHRVPTPRIGGLGLLSFLGVGLIVSDTDTTRIICLLSVSALPVFAGGFGEDTGFDVTPKTRLIMSFASAALAGLVLNALIEKSGVPLLDVALSITFVSIVFTLLISALVGFVMH